MDLLDQVTIGQGIALIVTLAGLVVAVREINKSIAKWVGHLAEQTKEQSDPVVEGIEKIQESVDKLDARVQRIEKCKRYRWWRR
jgi:3-hydroxyacyl-CoA dehydrogenase